MTAGIRASVVIQAGDLSCADTDAVVNAANTDLLLGSGVAGAIRSRGGPTIQEECSGIGPISLGEVAVTGAGDLPARCVVHAAAMHLGGTVSEESLRSVTRRSLEEVEKRGLRSVAFPAIGTGVGGFSMQRCAEVMLEEVERFVSSGSRLEEIRFVLYDEPAYRVFECVRDSRKVRLQMERLKGRGAAH